MQTDAADAIDITRAHRALQNEYNFSHFFAATPRHRHRNSKAVIIGRCEWD